MLTFETFMESSCNDREHLADLTLPCNIDSRSGEATLAGRERLLIELGESDRDPCCELMRSTSRPTFMQEFAISVSQPSCLRHRCLPGSTSTRATARNNRLRSRCELLDELFTDFSELAKGLRREA